jgi:hypothetical protein
MPADICSTPSLDEWLNNQYTTLPITVQPRADLVEAMFKQPSIPTAAEIQNMVGSF